MNLVSSTPNGDGTYTRVYQFTAFTQKSIYDDQAAVTSMGWGIPYIVQ